MQNLGPGLRRDDGSAVNEYVAAARLFIRHATRPACPCQRDNMAFLSYHMSIKPISHSHYDKQNW